MSKKAYYEYLESDHWQELRRAKFAQAGCKCAACGKDNVQVACHHIRYKEPLTACTVDDLMVLCMNCHEDLHYGIKRFRLSVEQCETQEKVAAVVQEVRNGVIKRNKRKDKKARRLARQLQALDEQWKMAKAVEVTSAQTPAMSENYKLFLLSFERFQRNIKRSWQQCQSRGLTPAAVQRHIEDLQSIMLRAPTQRSVDASVELKQERDLARVNREYQRKTEIASIPSGRPITIELVNSVLTSGIGCKKVAADKLGLGWPLHKGWLSNLKHRINSGEAIYTQ